MKNAKFSIKIEQYIYINSKMKIAGFTLFLCCILLCFQLLYATVSGITYNTVYINSELQSLETCSLHVFTSRLISTANGSTHASVSHLSADSIPNTPIVLAEYHFQAKEPKVVRHKVNFGFVCNPKETFMVSTNSNNSALAIESIQLGWGKQYKRNLLKCEVFLYVMPLHCSNWQVKAAIFFLFGMAPYPRLLPVIDPFLTHSSFGRQHMSRSERRARDFDNPNTNYVEAFNFSCQALYSGNRLTQCLGTCTQHCPPEYCKVTGSDATYHCPSVDNEDIPDKECKAFCKSWYGTTVNCYDWKDKAKCKDMCETCQTAQGINYICDSAQPKHFYCPGSPSAPSATEKSYKGICQNRCDMGNRGGPQPYYLNCNKAFKTTAEQTDCRDVCENQCSVYDCFNTGGEFVIKCRGNRKELKRLEEKRRREEKEKEDKEQEWWVKARENWFKEQEQSGDKRRLEGKRGDYRAMTWILAVLLVIIIGSWFLSAWCSKPSRAQVATYQAMGWQQTGIMNGDNVPVNGQPVVEMQPGTDGQVPPTTPTSGEA